MLKYNTELKPKPFLHWTQVSFFAVGTWEFVVRVIEEPDTL